MYTPHTVTLFNVSEGADLKSVNNITILKGVFLDVTNVAKADKTGANDADNATLFVPFSVTAESTSGARKVYKPPKEYKEQSDGAWTLSESGDTSISDCFFVKGIMTEDKSFQYYKNHYDEVYRVNSVKVRDFGSPDMHHWQVGGK